MMYDGLQSHGWGDTRPNGAGTNRANEYGGEAFMPKYNAGTQGGGLIWLRRCQTTQRLDVLMLECAVQVSMIRRSHHVALVPWTPSE